MSPVLTTGAGVVPAAAAGGSVWLLDQITPQPTAAYSTRKLKSTATLALRISDTTGTPGIGTNTVGFDGSDDLDTSIVNTYYTANANCANCNGYYDQSGNGRDFLGTGNAVLKWSTVNSGALQTMNSHPAVFFSSSAGRSNVTSSLNASSVMAASAFTLIQSMRVATWGTGTTTETGFFQDGTNGYVSLNSPRNSTGIYSNIYDGADKTVSRPGVIDTNYVVVTRLLSGTLSIWLNGGTPSTTACGNIGDLVFHTLELTSAPSGTADIWMLDTLIYNTGLSNSEINTLMSASGVTNGNVASRAGATWTSI